MASFERELKSFLRNATRAYATDEYVTTQVSPRNYVGMWEDENYRIVDMWTTDTAEPDARVYLGRELVVRNGENIWGAGYKGVISADIEPEDLLASYARALMRPRPELPIRGPKSMRLGKNRIYRFGSVSGALNLRDFAVEEAITENGVRIYKGHLIGGILTNEAG
jgi:hypothetical protein